MVLNKEQKKALKEAKRLEKLSAESEAKKQLKRDEMKREIAAHGLKKGDLDKNWRDIMLKIKEPVFKKDIEITWNCFERAYDKKDNLINYTMKLRDIADEQFQRTISSFCVTVDTMVNKFLKDLTDMAENNKKETKHLLKRGTDEATTISKDHNTAENHMQLLLYHGHTTADNTVWTTRGENLVKEDEDQSKYTHDRENLRSALEDNLNSIWEQYKTVLKTYIVATAENQKHVRKLRRKENLMADIIASQSKKIANSDGLLKRFRAELGSYESGTKQAVFRERRNRYRVACHKLKRRMMNGCTIDVKQLAALVRWSDVAVEWLESASEKGEKIMRMAALCRKYESQREKIMPFGTDEPRSPNQVKNLRFSKSDDSLIANALSTTCGLTKLWQRISKADLTRRALYREKIFLVQENSYIMHKIQILKKNVIGPESYECLCDKKVEGKERIIQHPVAIDGNFEFNKYNKI